jgi:hypothetical protein
MHSVIRINESKIELHIAYCQISGPRSGFIPYLRTTYLGVIKENNVILQSLPPSDDEAVYRLG